MPKRQICENLHFDFAKDKLILTIPSNHHSTINMRELCQIHYKYFPPNVIKKVGDTYIICKSLSISNGESSEESKKCEVKARLCFSYIIFGEVDSKESLRLDFQHCEFHKRVYFTNCEFNGNVFFNHAKFYKYADFHESIFNGVVSFYNAEFKYAPNFSTCVFQNLQATNFINVKIDDIDFDKIKEFIDEYKNDETYKKEVKSLKEKYSQKLQESKENQYKIDKKYKEVTKEHKIRYASNARDSFRTIKNVLIANNNLLDACAWHKLELYAKEHELKLQKPCLLTVPKKWCDLWQLKFYRHTSAHHTDLLKILSWFVILVGGFATILFFIKDLDSIVLWGGIFAVAFISLLLCALFKKISCFGFFTLLSLVPCAWLLTWNPKYIFGVANLFGNDKCQSDILLNLILSLYSIAFILVIFSLQKTARKNSIIPN